MDGSRRLGPLAVVAFHGLDGVEPDVPGDDAYDLVVRVAPGQVGPAGAAASAPAAWRSA